MNCFNVDVLMKLWDFSVAELYDLNALPSGYNSLVQMVCVEGPFPTIEVKLIVYITHTQFLPPPLQ